ncbi:eCIS core domain-containing protein [Massilia genomosp. 1]|uniref:DUF4157 domain-containing protein n=1 Tax=Massilia genomosp. 1 TaxID=2609280 RepID=A0ABX0MVX2_9BURK|nr:DUF4157 domain-containing protein [Massilia genomosp. 1]NHZ64618.1 DUF4157 domain-containing protein [Massilia genomosp. 1]
MRAERIAARVALAERRPAQAVALARQPAAAQSPAQSPAQGLRQRLGNQGTQALLASASAPAIECMRVTAPNDPAEIEAQAVASRVMRIAAPEPVSASGAAIARAPAGPAPAAPASIDTAGGTPLPAPVRSFMEPRFGADFSKVRIHTGEAAAAQSAQLNANAFALGQNVFFGRGQYQPDTAAGKELIAHELTHTIQQGASPQGGAVRRSAAPAVTEHVSPRVQGDFLGIPNPREYFARRAAAVPGFTMLTVVIGFNPINNARVDRNAGNILRGAIEMIPGGNLITEALNNHGVFDSVSGWAAGQFQALRDIGAALWQDIENFISRFSLLDLRDPGALWDRAWAIVARPLDRIRAFAVALKDGIVNLIKDAILRPVAAFARSTRGYPLLCTVMGRDPITGEPVAQDPVSLLGEFMKFIGEEEIWANMQRANAIPRAFAWFRGALGALRGFVNEIPGLFMQAFRALQIVDILLVPRAFARLAGVFGGFAARFLSWGADAAWNLLEIIFDVVSPGALAYIKRTGSALKSILRNPLPFVGNLVRAAKQGFLNFGANFMTHLRTGLIEWLTGSLPGIYIPRALSLTEIAKFAFSVLGLTWANIRQKLVRATSETVVKSLETSFDIVATLVREGPAAAWDKIKEQLANLQQMVIGGISDFVVDMVVQRALPRLAAMFIPGAGFISAILSIYDTVMVFVHRISQIVQVVTGFIDSIVNIAAGDIGAAATRVESTLARLLSLAIHFLAGFAGMGRVADRIMGIFARIRAPIDRALDWLVNWIVTTARKLGRMVVQAGVPQDPKERLKLGLRAAVTAVNALRGNRVTGAMITPVLAAIKIRYGLRTLEPVAAPDGWWIEAEINPRDREKTNKRTGPPTAEVSVAQAVRALRGGAKNVTVRTEADARAVVAQAFPQALERTGPGPLSAIPNPDIASSVKKFRKDANDLMLFHVDTKRYKVADILPAIRAEIERKQTHIRSGQETITYLVNEMSARQARHTGPEPAGARRDFTDRIAGLRARADELERDIGRLRKAQDNFAHALPEYTRLEQEGVLYGHTPVAAEHPHRTNPHINVEYTPSQASATSAEGVVVTIYISQVR